MAYASQEARQDLLASIAEAVDELGRALAALGDAYDQLDEHTADVLEEQMFRPAQAAYARAQRTHSGFAERHGLEGRTFEAASSGAPRVGHGRSSRKRSRRLRRPTGSSSSCRTR